MKIALALICKGDDKEADSLKQCLTNVAPHVDGIFVTITHKKGEAVNKKTRQVAEFFNANVSTFEWIYDFAAARNYNFSMVPKDYDYILWCDADDVFRGLDKLRKTVEETPADGYSMFYLYAFDEYKNPVVVHHKTQIVKNDGCVEWAGELHEDFKENRDVNIHFIKGIERMHMSNHERFEEAKERNLEVALKQLEKHPKDPRSFWNVGNAYKALGKSKEALEYFQSFMGLSKSEDEKYIVRLRMAESYLAMNETEKALDEARYAIGLKPNFPDAYNLTGGVYLHQSKFKEARDMFLMALTRKPPYYEIMVYNPRDYDYVPLLNLAKAYVGLSQPTEALTCLKGCKQIQPKDNGLDKTIKHLEKESEKYEKVLKEIKKLKRIKNLDNLKKKIDSLPDEIRSHPAICNIRNTRIIRQESSGKDVVLFCGFTEEEWTPDTAAKKGIGGSEEAIIHLSNGLAERGWNVTVYNNCGHKELKFGKVTYRPFWSWNYRDKQDVVVLWRSPKLADYDINTGKLFVDLHDVIRPGEFTEERLKKIDKVFLKSEFHKSLFNNIPEEKIVVVPNGIVSELFEGEHEKDPYLLIHTSSPDRGLNAACDIFAKIKKEIPEAKMKWAYGWGVFDIVHGSDPEVMAWKNMVIKKMEDNGIENLGRVSHSEVAELYKQARVFLYPSEFAEIDCISLSKAMAAGAIPVTTTFAAMGEKSHPQGVFVKSDKTKDNWCDYDQYDFSPTNEEQLEEIARETVRILKSKNDVEDMRTWALDKFDWSSVVYIWDKEMR